MLILFDIDHTLIQTDGAGMRALEAAGRSLHGDAFSAEGVDYGGRLDPLITRDLLVANDIEPTPDALRDIRRAYGQRLGPTLNESDPSRVGSLPGVRALLDALAPAQDGGAVALGVLTGNFQETGAIKLRACGISLDPFPIRVWGDDSPHTPPAREHLPPVAMDRYATRFARPIEPSRVVVIGDTRHDITCAAASGCRSLGVATGFVSGDDLRDAGATRVVQDLTDTRGIVEWLLNPGLKPEPITDR